MTKLHSILSALRDEIAREITRLTPSREIDPRCGFTEFKADAENKDIKLTSSEARQFQIYPPAHTGDVMIGNSTSHPIFDIDITFSYPDSDRWMSAAGDDMSYVQWYFRTHPSAVAGVSLRLPNSDAMVVSDKHPDDSRRFYTITMAVQAEVTF